MSQTATFCKTFYVKQFVFVW